jgi:hypothetical protein
MPADPANACEEPHRRFDPRTFGNRASRQWLREAVGWVEPFAKPITIAFRPMGIAEFIIGPAAGRTRWLHPSYALAAIKASTRCVRDIERADAVGEVTGSACRAAKALVVMIVALARIGIAVKM